MIGIRQTLVGFGLSLKQREVFLMIAAVEFLRAYLQNLEWTATKRRITYIRRVMGDGGRIQRGGAVRHMPSEGGRVMATPRRSDRPGLLLWLNTTVKLRSRLLTERGVAPEEMTVRPEDTLREAGLCGKRQARYQRRMSSLLAGREGR